MGTRKNVKPCHEPSSRCAFADSEGCAEKPAYGISGPITGPSDTRTSRVVLALAYVCETHMPFALTWFQDPEVDSLADTPADVIQALWIMTTGAELPEVQFVA